MRDEIEYFVNDRYLILKILKNVEKDDACLISQNDLVDITGFSKFKINAIINELIEAKYIKYNGRRNYSLTKKASDVIEFLENEKGV